MPIEKEYAIESDKSVKVGGWRWMWRLLNSDHLTTSKQIKFIIELNGHLVTRNLVLCCIYWFGLDSKTIAKQESTYCKQGRKEFISTSTLVCQHILSKSGTNNRVWLLELEFSMKLLLDAVDEGLQTLI